MKLFSGSLILSINTLDLQQKSEQPQCSGKTEFTDDIAIESHKQNT